MDKIAATSAVLTAGHTCTPLATGIIADPYRFEPLGGVSFQFDYGIVGERGAVGIFRISVQPPRAWCGRGWT